MRKTIATLFLCLAAVCGVMAQKTTKIMTVEQKDGTKVVYKVSNVERVTFTEKEQAELDNQWAYNDDVKTIGTIVLYELGDLYQLSLYETENPQGDPDLGGGDEPDVVIVMPKSSAGKTVDLSSTEGQQIHFFKGSDIVSPTGTLQVKFDKFFKQITVNLEGEVNGTDDFRAAYKGSFKRAYTASGTITVTPKDGEATENYIFTPFTVLPTATGEPTQFAFADESGAEPADVKTGKVAVWVSVSASKLYAGDIDMATETDSYTFHYIDYTTGLTYTTVTAGTITTAQDYQGRAYVKVNATLEDGTVVNCEYVGNYIEVESLEDLIPTPILANGWHYYDSDGNETVNSEIGKVLYKVSTSYGYTTFYFYQGADDSKYSSDKVTLQVKNDWINGGKKDLSALADGDLFSIKYSDIELKSPDAKYSGYALVPNNGELTITCDDEGNYDFYLDIANKYSCTATSITDGGNNARLVLSYKGQMTGTY